MHIRPAVPSDFLAIAALDRKAWSENRENAFIPDGEHVWRVWIDTALVLVAEDGDKVIGAAVAFADLDGKLFLHKIFISKDFRGQGIGLKLLNEVDCFADQKKRTVLLTVDPVNENAIALYEKCGYQVLALVPAYYRETEPRLLMQRVPIE